MKRMLKDNRNWVIASFIGILLPMLFGFAVWDRLPEQIPTHFGFDGQPDGYSGKLFAVVLLPVLLSAVQIILLAAVSADPKQQEDQKISARLLHLILLILPVVSLFAAWLSYSSALGKIPDAGSSCQLLIGALFAGIGNYMPKIHQNYTIGIRLPWTLDDPENWYKTHRVGGWCFLCAGVLLILNGVLKIGGAAGTMIVLVLCIVTAVVVPVVYSYWVYTQKQRKEEQK